MLPRIAIRIPRTPWDALVKDHKHALSFGATANVIMTRKILTRLRRVILRALVHASMFALLQFQIERDCFARWDVAVALQLTLLLRVGRIRRRRSSSSGWFCSRLINGAVGRFLRHLADTSDELRFAAE